MVGGVVLFVIVLTGGIAATQIVHKLPHDTRDRTGILCGPALLSIVFEEAAGSERI